MYSLATMCLRHDVEVASVLQQNAGGFGEKNQPNVESVRRRFVEFKAIVSLVRKLSSSAASQRHEADEKLRYLTGKQVEFNPAGNETAVGPSVFTYSPRNQLASADESSYAYDGRGLLTIATLPPL